MSPTRSESARLRFGFFVYTGLLSCAVPYWASMPSRHGTFQFVLTTDITNRAVPCRAGPLF